MNWPSEVLDFYTIYLQTFRYFCESNVICTRQTKFPIKRDQFPAFSVYGACDSSILVQGTVGIPIRLLAQ